MSLNWKEAVGKVDAADPKEKAELALKRKEFYRSKAAYEVKKLKDISPPSLKTALDEPEKYGFVNANALKRYTKSFNIPKNAKTARLSEFLETYFKEVVTYEFKDISNEEVEVRAKREAYLALYYLSNKARDRMGRKINVDLLLPGETVVFSNGKLSIGIEKEGDIGGFKYRIDEIDLRPRAKSAAPTPPSAPEPPAAPAKMPTGPSASVPARAPHAPASAPASASAPAAEKLSPIESQLQQADQALKYLTQKESGEVPGEKGKQSINVMVREGLIKDLQTMMNGEKAPGEVIPNVEYLRTEVSVLTARLQNQLTALNKQPQNTESEDRRQLTVIYLETSIRICAALHVRLSKLEKDLEDMKSKFLPGRYPGTIEAMRFVTKDHITGLSRLADEMNKF